MFEQNFCENSSAPCRKTCTTKTVVFPNFIFQTLKRVCIVRFCNSDKKNKKKEVFTTFLKVTSFFKNLSENVHQLSYFSFDM